ncbi:hypothetical protein JQS43_18780 [Natronosporangium hydrolyticum]|uniref:Uncharacterized protein n=1 Tax=Natronosporangium hydrolyticum TaxID=2811111 RepID=A0A895YGE4_9ACTN|nr:hypothetical protein [Natronosporangium hydrolyticum]QSB13606.1 hypothetical protein JQS43_18780 [Natronosporangium hydrolyticum]
MTTPEWLRPVSERYLGGELGPPPRGVRIAAMLAGVNALLAAGILALAGPATIILLTGPVAPLTLVTSNGLLAVAGLLLLATLAPSAVQISRRGWYRIPVTAGWVLTGLAAFGFCVVADPGRIGGDGPRRWSEVAGTVPWLAVTLASALTMTLLLRSAPVSSWLARRRHQVRPAPPDAAGAGQ